MIEIQNQKYFDEVKSFAETTGRMEQLQKKLDYLDTYAEHGDRGASRCSLYKDWAPHSFGFTMEKRDDQGEYQYWFNGGMIYYSIGDSGVGMPQFSVRIGNVSKSDWSINT